MLKGNIALDADFKSAQKPRNGPVTHRKPELRLNVEPETDIQNSWLEPTPEMLNDPRFDAVWNVIKQWDINVPGAYIGYCGATGSHVRAILDALDKLHQGEAKCQKHADK